MGLRDMFEDKMNSYDEKDAPADHQDEVHPTEEEALTEDDQVVMQEHFAVEDANAVAEPGFGERLGNTEDAEGFRLADLDSSDYSKADYTEDDEPRASM